MTFIEALVEAAKTAAVYNRDDQTQPCAVLWPDADRQWEPMLPLLRERLPIFTLGKYAPETSTGPAYWLRCVIERTIETVLIPEEDTPIIYLPGFSRQDIRAIEECPKEIKPLAELQYRGSLFTQRNARDWTIAAFLQTGAPGLGIATGSDQAAKDAIIRARRHLHNVPIDTLKRQAPLRATFFDELLTPDVTRDILLWLNDPAVYREASNEEEWLSFLAQSRSTYGINLDEVGPVAAAEKLGLHDTDPWERAWQRFFEAPGVYPNIPERLRNARPMEMSLFQNRDSWPQENEADEDGLRQQLLSLRDKTASDARVVLHDLEEKHGNRRDWVWAKLGRSPLAMALEHLTALGSFTETPLVGQDVKAIASSYADWGWQADNSVLLALSQVEIPGDTAPVEAAVEAVYRPWLEQGARALQEAVKANDFSTAYSVVSPGPWGEKTCLLFSDGLRLDLAHRLKNRLESLGLTTSVETRLTALPSITATSKPAVSPIGDTLTGGDRLDPVVLGGGPNVNIEVLRKQLELGGYQVLKGVDTGDPNGRGWTESRDIDELGHLQPDKLARLVDGEIRELAQRIESLLNWGWEQVVVVTDHGWLYLPRGLPKTDLPQHLTEAERTRKGRCARLKEFSETDIQWVPWYWDANVRIAIAPGISCFEAGKKYEHGGLSPQECVTPVLTISTASPLGGEACSIGVRWQGMRCYINVQNHPTDCMADIRTNAGDPTSTVVTQVQAVVGDGTVSLLVENDDRFGHAAFAVVLGADGQVVAQVQTTIGGDS